MTVHEGPTLPPGELIAPAVGTDKDQPNFHNNYQDIEAFLRGRRAPRRAVHAADRRHLFHQPLVLHDRDDSQVRRADRLRGRRRQLLRQEGGRYLRQGVPPRRARAGRRKGRLGNGPRPRQVRLQHVGGRDRRGAHHELRPALDHRPVGEPPLRRFAEIDRADHLRRLRADAAAVAWWSTSTTRRRRRSFSGSATSSN